MAAEHKTTREKILEYIAKYNKKHGVPPTQIQIAGTVGVSKQRVNELFKLMKDQLVCYKEYKFKYFNDKG